jgi:hypothetical protein
MKRGDASDIDGQAERPDAAFGESDIEGKTAREAASELAKSEFQTSRTERVKTFGVWM